MNHPMAYAVAGAAVLVLSASLAAPARDARAERPEPSTPERQLLCRVFQQPLEGARAQLDTEDETTAAGAWVAEHRASYRVLDVGFSVGQKPTGYPVGYVNLCLERR